MCIWGYMIHTYLKHLPTIDLQQEIALRRQVHLIIMTCFFFFNSKNKYSFFYRIRTGLEIRNFQLSGHNHERSEAKPSEARRIDRAKQGRKTAGGLGVERALYAPLRRVGRSPENFDILPNESHSDALFWTSNQLRRLGCKETQKAI